ncbi:DNA-binding transcriptional regulator ChbR [compost metagenome]
MAFERLREGALSIAEIAEQAGFQEPSAFHRAFKKWTGQSPGSYRARLAGLRSTCGSGHAREETNAVDGTGVAGVRG